jgi:hypothetical protein
MLINLSRHFLVLADQQGEIELIACQMLTLFYPLLNTVFDLINVIPQ